MSQLRQKNRAAKKAEWNPEEVERVIDEIRFRLEERLRLDPRSMAYIYEHERDSQRFRLKEMWEGEFLMEHCMYDEKGGRRCIEFALTPSEAIALAFRLIRYAAEAYARERDASQSARAV
jgi:hypothetical protein